MVLQERFDIERRLGQGSFGATDLARERATGRAVAIKRLALVGLPEWRPVELFEREARVLRSLDHAGVPAFIDAFEDDSPDTGPCFYIVSEYIEGPTLQAEILGGRRWTSANARALFRAMLQTLQYLHSLSPRVVHRDIKPGNVVLRADGSPVLVDFGSVRDVAAQQPGGGLTIAGTAGYMAPEQAMGISDARSDLYGLAATMAHALTHVHPSELPRQGLRPQLADLAGLESEVATILERMLDPDPERRPATADEVLLDLEGRPAASSAALARRGAPAAGALARRDVDHDGVLATLDARPRTLEPEIKERLGYTHGFNHSVNLAMAVLFGGIALTIALGASGFPPVVALACLLASFSAAAAVPLHKRQRARALYASGSVTQGTIVSANSEYGQLRVKYTFSHGGAEFKGTLLTTDAFVANQVTPETPVFVFFDGARPQRHAALLPGELPKALRAG